ncbi:MAG: hypothetical protein C0404_14835, partial [Verrucomicrobia bacterium]|nr:hypothetical protein [Verrucomicrobiota bacterium]
MMKRLVVLFGLMGVMPVLAFGGGAPTWVQEHYRWRSDDGSESTANWKANQDTAITGVARGQNIRLRFDVANTSTSYTGSLVPLLEFSTSSSGPWTAVSIAADGSTAFEMTATSGYANGDATTTQLTGSGTFVAGKAVEYPSNSGASTTYAVSQYSNFEYCFKATSKAMGSTPYYFRLSNSGTALNTYSQTAMLTMAAGEANEPPVIVSSLSATGSVITSFSYKIRASGSEPITLNATGVPAGLAFNGTNMITGTPSSAGSYSIGLTAASAWGSDSKTLSLSVVDNMAPVASNQTVISVAQGSELQISLAWGDADQPSLLAHTFTIISGPSHGTLTSYFQRNGTTNSPNLYYFKAATNFTGSDSFTWKCNDGKADSNVGTVTVPVIANNPPVANNQSQQVYPGQTSLSPSVTHGDTGQTLTYSIVSGPVHGTATVSGSTVTYFNTGWWGSDSFTWKCNDGKDDSNVATFSITMYQNNPYAANSTVIVLKNSTNNLIQPTACPGAPGDTMSIVAAPSHGTATPSGFKFSYTPAAGFTGADAVGFRVNNTGTTVSATCSIMVRDAASSNDWPQWRCDEYHSAVTLQQLPAQLYLQWRRDLRAVTPGVSGYQHGFEKGLEPVVVGKTLFVGSSSDNSMRAVDTETGAQKWVFFANGPIRLAPVAMTGRVLFGSEDGYLYCLNAADGSLAWKFRGGPSDRKMFNFRRLTSVWPVRSGPLLKDGKVFFAAGLWPFEGTFVWCLDPQTGAEIWRNDSACGNISGQPHDGIPMPAGPPVEGYMCVGISGDKLHVPGGRCRPGVFSLADGSMYAWSQLGRGGGDYGQWSGGGWWVDPATELASSSAPTVQVTAGSKTYTSSDASALGVSGSATAMLAADNKLFVATSQGSIYCFGGTQVTPNLYPLTTTPLPSVNDSWKTAVADILGRSNSVEGCFLVLGIGTKRLVEELVLQAPSVVQIVVVDPDTNKVLSLRSELVAAGINGTRVTVMAGDPYTMSLPPYIGRLVLSEDVVAAGFNNGRSFVEKVFASIRPYGGEMWLPTTDPQHSSLNTWVSAAGLQGAVVTRENGFSRLQRTGKPAEMNIRAPYGVLACTDAISWGQGHGTAYDPDLAAGAFSLYSGSTIDVYSGLPMTAQTFVANRTDMPPMPTVSYANPYTGFSDPRGAAPGGYGCGDGFHTYGSIMASRTGCAGIHDKMTDSGTFGVNAIRSGCDNSFLPGCGVLTVGGYGCGCDYPLTPNFLVLIPVAEVENWTRWGYGPTQNILDEKPIRRAGINFGPPGDRMAPDGKLWIEYPARSCPSPNLLISSGTNAITSFYHHSSRIQNDGLKWVAASGVKGLTNLALRLSQQVLSLSAASAPAIDGTLGDGCWNGAKPVMLVNTSEPADRRPAQTWLRYDANNLYVAFSCPAGGWGSGDSWNVYLSGRENIVPDSYYGYCGVNRYARFCVTAAGTKSQYLGTSQGPGGSEDNSWTGAWNAGVSAVNGQAFVAELAIPWTTIDAAGLWKDNLIINLFGPGKRRLRDVTDTGYEWAPSPGSACRRFVPMQFDTAKGDISLPVNNCSVKLHFAETEGATTGQRVFDVKLQGNTVLSNFDIFQQAGGKDRGVVKEFTLASVADDVVVDLVPKVGETMIAGIEVEGSYGSRNLNMPTARVSVSPASGQAPLSVTLSARESTDDVGIKKVEWNFGDGTAGTWSETTHTYTEPGTYTVVVRVTDSDGLMSTAVGTVTVGATGAKPQDFVCKIRASGGDYVNLNAWQTAIKSDLTASNSLLFLVSGPGSYSSATDDGMPVTFSGGATGVLRHVNSA